MNVLKMHLISVIALVFFVLTHGIAMGQNVETFSKKFNYFSDSLVNGQYERLIGVKILDSNMYLLMEVSNDTMYLHTMVLKTDLKGNLITYYHLGNSQSGYYTMPNNGFLIDRDSNIVVMTTKYSTGDHGHLTKLNRDLSVIWNQTYTIPDSLISPSCNDVFHFFPL